MRSHIRFVLGLGILMLPLAAAPAGFHVQGGESSPWTKILSSVGFESRPVGEARVFVVPAGSTDSGAEWLEKVNNGAYLILEGQSDVAAAFGFRPGTKGLRAGSVRDVHRPDLRIIWEQSLELKVFEMPSDARVFARERWEDVPLMAGFRRGEGAVLWVAVTPGKQGYERFPYILHALNDLGLEAPFRSRRLWAFFDSSYRSRVDLDYFADRWRSAGVSALHVAAWHFFEPDPTRDEYLRTLIASCHRRGILVYAWLELPHVSEKFWDDHPAWREKTALLQDAHLDWRKLMNLTNPECFESVSKGVRSLVGRFDWDGVNVAELYFESLEGHENASRFTPMNDDVRGSFQEVNGFDPLTLFQESSPRHFSKDAEALRTFLDFRAELAHRIQTDWIAEVEAIRRLHPHLDFVLTHVDDRFDTRMRDAIGADAESLMPWLDRHDFTFLVEDPATVWHLGPQRYTQIAERYRPLTSRQEKLAIDINVVERYQDVYPTLQQTGTELFQLVRSASRSFPRVALYFENSILSPDLALLPSAAALVDRAEQIGPKLVIDSPYGVGIPWKGPALVNGLPWPFLDDSTLWLPPGPNAVEAGETTPSIRLIDFNGDLKTVSTRNNSLEIAYQSSSRAFAIVDKPPRRVEIDGAPAQPRLIDSGDTYTLYLPRGQHLVTVETE